MWKVGLLCALLVGCTEDPSRGDAAPKDGPGSADRSTPPQEGGPGPEAGPTGDGPGADASTAGDSAPPAPDTSSGIGLAAKYPGDKGLDQDPQVVWTENFEEGSVAAVLARYENHKNQAGMSLVGGVPANSSGQAAIKMVAGGGTSATDFYRRLLPGHEQLYVRYYVKYQSGVDWHHTGVWIGGYNPDTAWPSPQAGLKPDGDDRFSVAIEAMGAGSNPGPRLDFYNYWMKMHSWMDNPSGSTAYYGNTLVHKKGFRVTNDAWMCIEIMVKLNPGASSGAGAELAVWQDDTPVLHFTDTAPLGYWVKDKFCHSGADNPSCTDYPPPSGTTPIPLDLQWRNTTALKLNYFWPQNYVTSGPAGAVYFDDMVIAKVRVGCLQ